MDRQLRELERQAQGGDVDAALLLIQRTADLAGGELHISYSEDPWGVRYIVRITYHRRYASAWPELEEYITIERTTSWATKRVSIKGKRKIRYDIPNRIYLHSYLSLPNVSRDMIAKSHTYKLTEQVASLYQFYKDLITLEECKALFDQGATVEQIRAFAARS